MATGSIQQAIDAIKQRTINERKFDANVDHVVANYPPGGCGYLGAMTTTRVSMGAATSSETLEASSPMGIAWLFIGHVAATTNLTLLTPAAACIPSPTYAKEWAASSQYIGFRWGCMQGTKSANTTPTVSNTKTSNTTFNTTMANHREPAIYLGDMY